jgi:nucleotide-binding universal stress UspA family protein
MYKKILAPLDGSKFSECSLEHVRAVALGCRVPKVVLLRVVEPIHKGYGMGEDWAREAGARQKAEAKSYLSKLADDLKKEGIATRVAVVGGMPADEILDYASKNQVSLIIMSTNGRSGVSRWFLGSVAERVLRYSPVPLLVVSPPGCRR